MVRRVTTSVSPTSTLRQPTLANWLCVAGDQRHTVPAVQPPKPNELSSAHGWNRYRPLCELGSGGMATVHLALFSGEAGFRKLVALKQLSAALSEDPEFQEMFMNEGRLAARLNHPNVIQTYEVGWRRGRPFIAMELLEGQSLHRLQRASPTAISLALQLRIISEALAGLHHAHELRDFSGAPLEVVHRDVSPQNVLVGYDGQTKVVDFGIAKAATHPSVTQVGVIKGKLSYLSPEQALGQPVDRRTDLFAIGVMLWEAAAGRRVWAGESPQKRLRLLRRREIPPLREFNPDVPAELERICRRALEYSPERRYQTALELEADLEALRAEPSLHATRQQVASFIQRHFEAPRRRLQQIIEAELGQLSLDQCGSPSAARPTAAVVSGATEQTMPGTVAVSRALPFAARSNRRWLGMSLAAVGAVAVVGAFLVPRSSTSGAQVLAATTPEPVPRAAETAPPIIPVQAAIVAMPKETALVRPAGASKGRPVPDAAPRRRSTPPPQALERRSRY
jgi:eukaryotic-like serine/threonine-protein kinase